MTGSAGSICAGLSKYEGKAVQSKRSPVANISQFLKTPMTTGEFIQFLSGVQLENPENNMYHLNEIDLQVIEKLSAEKFKTWEWNFGYSPKYSFKNEVVGEGKMLKINLQVERGIIAQVEIIGDYFSPFKTEFIQSNLFQMKHDFDEVRNVFQEAENQIIYSFFG